MIKQVDLFEIFGFCPKKCGNFKRSDPMILKSVRKCLVEKSISELLPDFGEDGDGSSLFPSLQIGSSSGSIPNGVWVSKDCFIDCATEELARLVLSNFIAHPSP